MPTSTNEEELCINGMSFSRCSCNVNMLAGDYFFVSGTVGSTLHSVVVNMQTRSEQACLLP